MTDLNASMPQRPVTAPSDAKSQEGAVLAAGTVFVKAFAVCVNDRVRTPRGDLRVTFMHTEGVSVVLHMTMPDGDTLIYHVAPDKALEVIGGDDDGR